MLKSPSLVDMDSLHAKSLQDTGGNYDVLSNGKHFGASLNEKESLQKSNSPKSEKGAPQGDHVEQG